MRTDKTHSGHLDLHQAMHSSMSSASTMTRAGHHRALGLRGKQCPFLHLPRELRDLVYIELLKGLTAPPPSLADVIAQGDRIEMREYYGISRIMYPRLPSHLSSAASLLLVNRQVHAEVTEVLGNNSRLETRPLTYRLDCMAVNERKLYPTWLSVPALSSNVDVVEANLRFCGDVKRSWKNWDHGSGGPGRTIWSLYALLIRFLTRGADFLSEQPKSTRTTVGLLVLNVVTPPEEVVRSSGCWFVGLEPLGLLNCFESYVVLQIAQGITALLHDEHGKMMREQVGLLRLCVDGRERWTFDMADIEDPLKWVFL